MRSRIAIVVVAVVLGAVAAVLAANYLHQARVDIAGQNQPVDVLVAQKDLPRGVSIEQLVQQGLVTPEKIPAQFVAADAVSSERSVADQVLASDVGAGEQLTKSRFDFPADAGLSYTIPAGFVAVSLAVDDVSGVAGLVKPGDSVVVYASYEPAGRESAVTKMAVAKARVLAVGAKITAEAPANTEKSGGVLGGGTTESEEEQSYSTVTVALKSVDAQQAAFTHQFGKVQLALLPEGSEEVTGTPAISFEQVVPAAGTR